MSYRKLLEEHLASRSLEIRPFLETGDTPLICRLVGQDMGLSFLPDFVTQKAVEARRNIQAGYQGFLHGYLGSAFIPPR